MYKFYFQSSIRLYLLLSIFATFSTFAQPLPKVSPQLTHESTQLHLTENEKKWLSTHPVIKVGIDPDYAPYEWIDKDGNHVGMVVDYMHRLEKKLGLRFEIVKNKPWTQMLNMAKNGEIDMLTSIVKTPERSKYLTFSEPYRDAPTIIIDNGNGSFIGSLKQLSNKRVSVEKGYFMEEFMKNNYPKIIRVPAPSTKEALKMVVNGSADAYVGDANIADFTIKSNNYNTLRFSGQTEYISHQSFALTKGNEPLANILTKAMATIPKEESDVMFNRWLNIEQGIKSETLIKYGAVITLILLVTGYWVYRLRREINNRKVVEEKLRRSETLYRQLTEDVGDVIWKADQNLFITYISPSDERLRGFRADEVIGHHIFEMFTDDGITLITKKMQERKEAEAKGIEVITLPFEVQYRCKDGSLIWWEVISNPERARFGGDEFIVMLNELGESETESRTQAELIAEKIRSVLSVAYQLTHESITVEHHCTASIGVLIFKGEEKSEDELFNQADTAMYQAKEAGRNNIRFYDSNSRSKLSSYDTIKGEFKDLQVVQMLQKGASI